MNTSFNLYAGKEILLVCKDNLNIGVTFLGKWSFVSHRNPRFFADSESRGFWNRMCVCVCVCVVFFLKSAIFEICGFYQNPRILQKLESWGLGLWSSKVFQTKEQ